MNRQQLLQLRPEIPSISQADATTSAEQFQNRTLRPILKFQNELLCAIFRAYLDKRKGAFFKLSKVAKLNYVSQSVRKDHKFKQLLIGTIIGQLTQEEWLLYQKEEKAINRRISDLLVQRLQDQCLDF